LLGGLPVVLAALLLLGSLQVLDASGLVYYPTIHRATITRVFSLGFSLVVPLAVLLVAWFALMWVGGGRWWLFVPVGGLLVYPLLGFGGALGLASLAAVCVGLWGARCFGGVALWVLVFSSCFEGLALVHWLVFLPLGLTGPLVGVADLELSLFFVSGYLAPLLVLPLLFSWGLRVLVEWGFDLKFVHVSGDRGDDVGWRRTAVFLVVLVFLGGFAAVYPYLGGVNPRGLNVGVDAPRYVQSMAAVDVGVSKAFTEMGGSRPLIFLVIYGFERVTGLGAEMAVRYLPVLLIPLLVLSAFYVGLQVFGRRRVALWSAFFMLAGVQVVVGVYAYFLTNMLALCLALFSVGLLFASLRGRSYPYLFLAVVVGGLLPYVHPWTFDQFLGSVGLFTLLVGYGVWKKRVSKEALLMLSLYIAFLVSSDVAKGLVFHGVGGFQATSTVVSGFAGLSEFWSSSIFNFRFLFGGGVSNVLLLVLSLIGVLYLDRERLEHRFWVIFLFATSLVFLVGDETIKSRLLFNVPFFLLSSFGVEDLSSRIRDKQLLNTLLLFSVLLSFTYLFRSLANFS
jgi:hypothetical protein